MLKKIANKIKNIQGFKKTALIKTKKSVFGAIIFLFASTTALGFNTQKLPFFKRIKSNKDNFSQRNYSIIKKVRNFSLNKKISPQLKKTNNHSQNINKSFSKKLSSLENTQKNTKKTIVAEKNNQPEVSNTIKQSSVEKKANEETNLNSFSTPISTLANPNNNTDSNNQPTNLPLPTPTTAYTNSTPTSKPVSTPTLEPTSNPTPTNAVATETKEVSLFPEGSATPNGNGKVKITAIKNQNGYWDFIVSGDFKFLQPQRLYQLWLCNNNCSSHPDAKFTTDNSGNGSISNVTISHAQGNDPLNRVSLWEVPPQGEIHSDPTTCYMISNTAPACLKGTISF